jgi:hypothetical protein
VTQTCPSGSVGPGGLFTFTGSVSNAGNITLDKVVVVNDQVGLTPLITVSTLAPGATTNFTGSYIVTTNFTTTSTSTASGTTSCGVVVSNSVTATCPTLIKVVLDPSVGVSATATMFNLTFPTENGISYTVQYKNTFTDPTWTNLRTITGTGSIMTITDTIAPHQPMRIYRIIFAP